jgi:LPXTG-motif cell wall-anchored protein
LNFVTGFFGMNFDDLPLIHHTAGVWLAVLGMLLAAAGMGWFFWRKRYWMHHEEV